MKKNFVKSVLAIVLFASSTSLMAQSDHLYQYKKLDGFNSQDKIEKNENNSDKNKDKGKDPTKTSVPFDGGLSLLVAAGAGIAAKKKFDKRKAKA